MYTHSIPWALHGKADAKRLKDNCPGGEIDKAFRLISHGQTVGIPIGPDPSLLVAEVVLTAVDLALTARLGRFQGFRQADDYEAAFGSRAQAEEALVILEGLLGDFELTLNPFKTKILELPQPLNATWPADLANFPIRQDHVNDRVVLNDLISLFSRAFEVKAAEQGAGALKYVLQRCRSFPVRQTWWPTYQQLILSVVSSEPTTMPVAIGLLAASAEQVGLPLDASILAAAVDAQILRNAPLRNGSEVAWALWAALTLRVPLTSEAAAVVVQMEDDIVALLALDAQAKGLFPTQLATDQWANLVAAGDALAGQHWLLAYEGVLKGWLDDAGPEVEAHGFFRVLRDAGVFFYEVDPVHDPFGGPAAPLPGGLLPDSSL